MSLIPAFHAAIMGMITRWGFTFRRRIPMNVTGPTGTPAARADTHSPTGTK